jgi:hypothetical protein
MSGAVIRSFESAAESGRAGTVDVQLLIEGRPVSSCRIIPLRLRAGAAVIRMDGIGKVETAEEFRQRGLARRVLSHALRLMEEGDAALTMLYGITDFYPKFGYVTVGPESTISLPPLGRDSPLPSGYEARPFRQEDLESVQRLYTQMTARSVGAAVRPDDGYPWTALLAGLGQERAADCRVVTDVGGQIRGYVWRGQDLSFVRAHSRYNPEDLVLAEAVAVDPPAADAVLTVCRQWAAHEAIHRGREVKQVLLFAPHEGPVTAAAMQMESTLARGYGPDGGWMARVLSAGGLLSSLQPELSRRLSGAGNAFHGSLRIVTETGEATLHIDGGTVRVAEGPGEPRESLLCSLPQTTLARLAMGAYPPEDLLARLENPPEETLSELLQIMFPARPAQIFLADRF